MRPAEASAPPAAGWWNHRAFLIALVLLSGLPLVWPSLPPITDALGHMARYHIELNLDSSPYLKRYFDFRWALMGNLGVDLLVIPLSKIFGLELAVKLIVLVIPPLTVAGLLWIAHEAHGRVPPTAIFAIPLAYGFPFQFGFLNHVLAMALAFNAFALWLRLGKSGRYGLRAALFVPLSAVIWLAHVFGWGVLGLLAFAAELTRDRREGGTRFHAIWRAALGTLPLVPPVLLMLIWRGGDVAGATLDWFNFSMKSTWLLATLRERWQAFDIGSVYLLLALIAAGMVGWRLRMQRTLALATAILTLAFLALPRILLGSAYADMRLIPYVLAIGLIGLRPQSDRRSVAAGFAIAACLFAGVRIGATTWNFAELDRGYQRQLRAVEHIRPGSAVLVLVNLQCGNVWSKTRMDHLGSLAIVRRDAFVNGQWTMPGAQLLHVTYTPAGRFALDPSQLLRPPRCRRGREPFYGDTVRNFPRDAFDYFWLIDMPRARWPHEPDLEPVWQSERGVLYRVVRSATSARDTPNGSVPRPIQ